MTVRIRDFLCATAALAAPMMMAAPALGQTAIATAAPEAGQGGGEAGATDLETIVVTASRREGSVREIPTAISAYSGLRLQDAHVKSLIDLVTGSPDVLIGVGNTNTNVTIRGIGNNLSGAARHPGAAIYLDGVYLAQPVLTTTEFLDVSRVEILRGPQGTLFGRSATGGAIDIIPNVPTSQMSFGVDASVGFDPTEDHIDGYVNGPLNKDGTLLGRLAVQQTYNEGFTKNLYPLGPDRLDATNDYSTRGQLLWQPSADFSARLSLRYQNEDDSGPAYFVIGKVNPGAPLPAPLVGQPFGNVNDRQVYANEGVRQVEAEGATLVTNWSVGGGTLKGTFDVNRTKQFSNVDGDDTPVDFTSTSLHDDTDQYFGEFVYASDPQKPFTYIIGGNYFYAIEIQNITVPISSIHTSVVINGDLHTDSAAVFAHAQYAFANGLKLFAGARGTYDYKWIYETNSFIGKLTHDASWLTPSYEAGVSYDFNKSVTGYFKYAVGYKSGGFSSGSLAPAFNPETDQEYEVGLKGSYFDGALEANLAAFHTDYENLQVNQIIGVANAVKNAAQATTEGVEIETVERVSPSLHFELSGAWLNARFQSFMTQDSARPTLGVLNLAGNLLPFAPHFSARAAGYYDIPITVPGKLTLSADYDWKSLIYFTAFNLGVSSQPAAGTLNLALDYTSEDQRWGAGLYARNVTDELIRSNGTVGSTLIGAFARSDLQPGREVGFALHYRY